MLVKILNKEVRNLKLNILKQKDFLLLINGKFLSLIGTQMQDFALSLYVLKITGSATKFASVLAVTFIPAIIVGPIAGVFIDKFNRKKILIYLDIISGIIVLLYAAIYNAYSKLPLAFIYILVILLSLISLMYNPTVRTVIPSILKKEELLEGNEIDSFVLSFGNFIAPALAGMLLSFSGLFIILIINSISFFLSAIFEMFINIPIIEKKHEKISFNSFLKDFTEGLKFIKSQKFIFNIIIMCLVINFFAPIFSVGITYISKQIIKISDLQYGNMESIFTISMIIAPFICNIISKNMGLGHLLFFDFLFTSVFMMILGFIASPVYLNLFCNNTIPYLSITIIFFIVGLTTSIGNIYLGTAYQKQTPIYMLGRVNTLVNTVSTVAIPLGMMIFGILFDRVQAFICVLMSGICLFIIIFAFKNTLFNND